MLDLKIFKNGKYEDLIVHQGWTYKKTLNEELNETTIMFEAFGKEPAIKLWQSVKAWNDYFVATYIQKDNRPGGRWQHLVILSEPTKYLEKAICPSMSFTNKTDTLYEQIRKALINAEPVEAGVGNSPRFRLSNGAAAYLANIAGADFYFDKMTLREILDGFLAKIDSRCVVKELTDFNDIVIDFVSIAQRGKKITLNEFIKTRTIESVELLGSDIESYADNALVPTKGFSDYGGLLPIFHPSSNGWDTFKTNEATLTTDNALIATTYPIERIVMFTLPGPFILVGHKTVAGTGEVRDNLIYYEDFNVGRNVFDAEEYAALYEAGLTTEVIKTDKYYKENVISYTKGDTEIRNIRHSLGFFGLVKGSAIKYAAQNAFWNDEAVKAEVAKGEYDSYTITVEYNFDKENISKIMYRLIYIPQLDAHLKISKEDYQGPPATIISQQGDKKINIERYGDNLYGQVNRLGNQELEYDKIHESPDEIYELGDYTEDNYILTARTLAVNNNFIKAHYQFTQNFNALSTKIGIDRERRVYNIPLEYFRSDTIIKEYIIAWFGSPAINDKLIDTFMFTFGDAPGSSHITNALLRSEWGADKHSDYLELPAIGYAAANSLNFQFRFKDNYSAGPSVGNPFIGGRKMIPNPYCNPETGEYEQIEIKLFNGRIKTQAADELARAQALPKAAISDYNINGFLYSRKFLKYKDTYEHQSFTICFEIKSLEPDIIIGPALAQNCALFQTLSDDLFVYVASAGKYFIGDKLIAGAKATNQNIYVQYGALSVSFDDANITRWAIGDAAGNLYIACNRPNVRGIQFQHRKKL